jgi:hypothetical protein
MSLTNARDQFPSILYWSSAGSTGTLTTAIAGITSISGVKKSRNVTDITDMNSTDGYEDVMLSGPVRMAALSMQGNYLSTSTHLNSLLQEAMDNGTRCGWKLVMAGTSSNNTYYGDSVVTNYGLGDMSVDGGKIGFSFDMRIKGKPTGPVSSTT